MPFGNPGLESMSFGEHGMRINFHRDVKMRIKHFAIYLRDLAKISACL
jgi:hypothetical protein